MIEESLKIWLLADAKIQKIKTGINDLKSDLADAEEEAESAKLAVQEVMAATGEYEVNVSGEYCDYRIYFTTPRSSIKVAAPEVVPDEFCKIERVPRLTEIKEYLATIDSLPNWATIEVSTPKLTYKIQKKKG
jgi:hypothetical protein